MYLKIHNISIDQNFKFQTRSYRLHGYLFPIGGIRFRLGRGGSLCWARVDLFAGLRASFAGAGNLGHFLLRHRREAADARSRFQMHHGRARDADFCGTSKAWRFLTGWGEELLPVATACITGAGGSGWKTTMGCLMGFLVIFLFSEDPSVIGVCTVR